MKTIEYEGDIFWILSVTPFKTWEKTFRLTASSSYFDEFGYYDPSCFCDNDPEHNKPDGIHCPVCFDTGNMAFGVYVNHLSSECKTKNLIPYTKRTQKEENEEK